LLVALGLAVSASAARAQSDPAVEGRVKGIELAPQTPFNPAIFVGAFAGQAGPLPQTVGVFYVGVSHDGVPGGSVTSSAITGGDWALWAVGGAFSGQVAGGVILRDGDTTPRDVFPVFLTLQLTQGGTGTAYFVGELDHRPWVNHRKPPRIRGAIVQSLPAP
jgi:hypothetical protein